MVLPAGSGAHEGRDDNPLTTFEQVFEVELANMLRVAYLLLNSQALAEEVVQDSFAKLLTRFDEIKNPGGFLHRTTVNGCHDLQRRRKRERNIVTRIRPAKPVDQTTAPLDDVLAELSVSQREVVVLRYYLGYHAGTGQSPGCVRNNPLRAGPPPLRRKVCGFGRCSRCRGCSHRLSGNCARG